MDRNVFLTLTVRNVLIVALRKESVDRNVNLRVVDGSKSVALRKESVDRNCQVCIVTGRLLQQSLSARRAWIEISGSTKPRARRECRSPQGERG